MNTYRRSAYVLMGLFLSTTYLYADDIEVYRTQASDEKIKPNLLFVLDESSSMGFNFDGDSTTRTEDLQIAMRAIFAPPDPDDLDGDGDLGGITDVNAAMLGYSNQATAGRRIISNFMDVDNNRSAFLSLIDTISSFSGTVTVQAMAASVDWYKSSFTGKGGTVGTTPITSELYCAQNHVILLTDGEPYSHQPSASDPHPFKAAGFQYEEQNCTIPDPSGFSMNRAGCTGDIAAWANTVDLFPAIQDTQNVITQTIGFFTGASARDYLLDIATRGGGNYYESSDTASLVAAINAIVNEAKSSVEYTYNAPVVPFNPDASAISGDAIYIPVFEPQVTAFWKGNLKKYTINVSDSGITLESAPGGGSVISTNNLFLDSAQSFWSGFVDGKDILAGGAVSQFSGTRKLYTYVDGSSSTDLAANVENHVTTANPLVTHTLLGISVPADINDPADPQNIARDNLLKWANWTDATNEHENQIGAPLHTKPAVVSYAAANDVVLLPTTEGVLEAIDVETGAELWAFMPQELLQNIGDLKLNAKTSEPIYGLDGPMTVYQTNGKTMVVFGMRRGGKNYYALDITNREVPLFAWKIMGGVTTNFQTLGQTWSKPQFIQIFSNMDITQSPAVPVSADVLAFGGGYDADKQDIATSRVDDDLGRTIYIVNAESGTLRQSITDFSMKNSIAADIVPVDINANGITDRIYAADVGGRVIRVDLSESASSYSVGVIGDVNDGGSQFHRFFNAPEVGYFDRGGKQFLAIFLGSGQRPNPLDKLVTDSFYMIKDPNIWAAPDTYESVTRSNLHNSTENKVQEGSDAEQETEKTLLGAAKGWYVDMPNAGEKVFSQASVYDYAVMFTTYSGTRSGSNDICAATATSGESSFWALDMLTGGAVFDDLDGNTEYLNTADRKKLLSIPGIPPTPTLLFPGTDSGKIGKEVIALVGLQEVTRWPDRFRAIFWESVIGE